MNTRQDYAEDVIRGIVGHYGWRRIGIRNALVSWSIAECGAGRIDCGFDQGAAFNMFGSTLVVPGSSTLPGNTSGVQCYPSYEVGVAAIVATLREPRYSELVDIIKRPFTRAQVLLTAIGESQWGTSPEGLTAGHNDFRNDPSFYNNLVVGRNGKGSGMSEMTRADFANELLLMTVGVQGWKHIGARRALVAWMIAESGEELCDGRPNEGAAWNPMNSTWEMPGSTPYNTFTELEPEKMIPKKRGVYHVWNYPSAEAGIEAFARTLHGESRYEPVLEKLAKRGVFARNVLGAVGYSPWGTDKWMLLSTRKRFNNNRKHFNNITVGA